MSKDKNINDERGLVGKVVSVTCIDRAESEFTDCECKAINEAGILLAWESRGIFNLTHIPKHNIGFVSVKYSNAAPAPEQKPV